MKKSVLQRIFYIEKAEVWKKLTLQWDLYQTGFGAAQIVENLEKYLEKIFCFVYNKEKALKGVDWMRKTADNCAILKSDSQYTIFIFRDQIIRFRTSSKLEKYTEVKEWDKGYLVVMAKYKNLNGMEEYIDLVPILQNLYYDVDEFLAPIKEVQIDYAA